MIPSKESIYELMTNIKVMKPNKVDPDNTKACIKLDSLLDSDEYAAEEKIDGCHYVLASHLIFSTRLVEKTDNFPHIRDFFISLGMPNIILDGEINYPGKTSQYCTRVTGADPSTAKTFQEANGYIHYTLYDMLRTPKGTWLMKEPFKNRRIILETFYRTYIAGTPLEKFIHLSDITYTNKRKFLADILEAGREGIVLKKLTSLYAMGKKPVWQWMKIKQHDEADFVILGFQPANKATTTKNLDDWPYWEDGEPVSKYYSLGWVGSVILGAYVDGVLQKICTASGMDEKTREDMTINSESYVGRVAKVTFMEATEANIPRHPNVECIHEDKLAEECTWTFSNDDN